MEIFNSKGIVFIIGGIAVLGFIFSLATNNITNNIESDVVPYSNIALSGSITFNNDSKIINCTTDTPSNSAMIFNTTTWSLGCFNYRTDVCSMQYISDVLSYNGSGANASTLLATEFTTSFGTMCCYPDGTLCMPSRFDGQFYTCDGLEYDVTMPFMWFNYSSNQWEGLECLKGIL